MLEALDRAPVWLNAEPLTAAALRGRVVAVDFWTYSCVNWLRTLPYVSAWHERYGDRGLTVVGVHAPEFSFEHDLDNVRHAVGELDVRHPVVIDNDFAIWRAFDNHYWPALYLVDRDGQVAFHHFGEGAYEECERAIQSLLRIEEPIAAVEAHGLAEAADWDAVGTPETYVGSARGDRPRGGPLALNQWSHSGQWTDGPEFAELAAAPGAIAFRFQARDVNLVLTGNSPFTVTLDGEPPREDHGVDTDERGRGVLDEPRMYQLIRQRTASERTVEIAFEQPGVRAYVFTFG
jgi:thiol-disulfide isomerase/thioredoxin